MITRMLTLVPHEVTDMLQGWFCAGVPWHDHCYLERDCSRICCVPHIHRTMLCDHHYFCIVGSEAVLKSMTEVHIER